MAIVVLRERLTIATLTGLAAVLAGIVLVSI
jgi:uncharacterized membrane protein